MSQNQTKKDIKAIFRPNSVAIVGASSKPEKIGHQILKNIVEGGFSGGIYPINPKEPEILGCKAFTSVLDVEGEIDLAIVSVPAPFVKATMEECAKKKVKAIAVITSGFGEVGKKKEEQELVDIANEANMAMIGPNIFGIVYAPTKFNASFGPREVLNGKIAFVSQSGALTIAMMGWTSMEKIGLAALVSVGNKADVDEKDLIEYFNSDENVEAVLIYMEGLTDGAKFMTTEIKKPVVMLKVGRSERGAKAAASHTGSLSGSDKVFDAAFKQVGILRADTFTQAFGWSRTLSLPAPDGDEVVVITNGGGIGVRATDECESAGLSLLEDTEWLEEKFRSSMPDYGSTKNPIDITGGAGLEGYKKATGVALAEDRIKAILVLYCETVITDPQDIAKAVYEAYEASGRKRPVLAAMVGGERTKNAIQFLNQNDIPAFDSVHQAVSALKVLYQWKEISAREKDNPKPIDPPKEAVEIIENAKKEGRDALLEHEARKCLELCGVPTPKWGFATTLEEAKKQAEGMYPLAMKITSPDIIHKTDVGGVIVGIRSAEELEARYNNMMDHIKQVSPDANILGVNLVQMVSGIECIVGLSRDPQFGPVVMFGLGGVFVEALKDVAFRVVPFGEIEAQRLIADIKAQNILNGFRGMQVDKPSIIKTLCAVQQLAPLVKEIDINPIMSSKDGSFAVDARIIL